MNGVKKTYLTLVELLMACVVSGIVLAIVVSIVAAIFVGFKAYDEGLPLPTPVDKSPVVQVDNWE